jgi:hypothetical protein
VGFVHPALAGRGIATERVAKRSLPGAQRAGLLAGTGNAQSSFGERDRPCRVALLERKPTLERAEIGDHIPVAGLTRES